MTRGILFLIRQLIQRLTHRSILFPKPPTPSPKLYSHMFRLSAFGFRLGLIMLIMFSLATPIVQASSNDDRVSDQIVVKLNPLSGTSIAAINTSYTTTTLRNLAPQLGIYLLQIPAGKDPNTVIAQMLTDTRLLYAEPNYIGEAPEGNPRNISAWGGFDNQPYVQQDALQQLDVAAARSLSKGAGVTVAVIDTGIQLDHPALSQRILLNGYDFVDGDTVPDDHGNGLDDDGDAAIDEMLGHGTHVAGIIHLIAPEAKIMPIRVLNSDGHGEFFALAEAISYAVDHGAQIINLSLGSSNKSDLLEEAIEHASQRGAIIVAAAGNLNTNNQQYPAATDCSLSVTSVSKQNLKSSFANYGSWLSFSAPGEAIYSAFPGNGYASWSGTSMATPFVAGQAALIRGMAPAARIDQIATLMYQTGDNIDNQNQRFSGDLGHRINIGKSLETLKLQGLPAPGEDKGIINTECVGASNTQKSLYLPMIAVGMK